MNGLSNANAIFIVYQVIWLIQTIGLIHSLYKKDLSTIHGQLLLLWVRLTI